MQFYVPEIGDQIELAADWGFNLYIESRNLKLCEAVDSQKLAYLKTQRGWYQGDKVFDIVTFRAGTVLKVERIYVRQGLSSYSSITFRVTESPHNSDFLKKRFWVKLADANAMYFNKK